MRIVYICSPYRAKDDAELDRNIEYAQALTKQAIEAGLAPITPHLYMTQCINEDKPEERAAGMAAGLELLKKCDFVIVGVKYGISDGMSREIQKARREGINVVNAGKLHHYMSWEKKSREEQAAWDYAYTHACDFCGGKGLPNCPNYECREPLKKAYEYAEKQYRTSG